MSSRLHKITFDQDSIFYNIIMGGVIVGILIFLWAFITCVHAGNFRKKLPGETCNPNKSQDCGDGLVCEPHDPEKSHPYHHPPKRWNAPILEYVYPGYTEKLNEDQYMCQIPEHLRLSHQLCQEHCTECQTTTNQPEEEEIDEFYRQLPKYLLGGVIFLIVTALLLSLVFMDNSKGKQKNYTF